MPGFFVLGAMKLPTRGAEVFWAQNPMLRIMLILGAGIVLQRLSLAAFYIGFTLFGLLFLWAGYRIISKRFTNSWFPGFLLLFCGVVLFVPETKVHIHPEFEFGNCWTVVEILPEPVQRDSLVRMPVAVHAFYNASGKLHLRTQGHWMLYIKHAQRTLFVPGDYWLIQCRTSIPDPIEPEAGFSLREWLHHNQCVGLLRADAASSLRIQRRNWDRLRNAAWNLRQRCLAQLEQCTSLKPRTVAMISALVLGARTDLDPEIKDAYQQTGLVHILAVSGMHVALVFGVIQLLLRKWKHRTEVRMLILCLIWMYALLTGMSASVVRAATMYSLLVLGEMLGYKNIGINSLCAVAVCMVIADPSFLDDLGFQLSFLAVWGILDLGPLFTFYEFSKWQRYVLQSAWISVVAQLATLPIIAHQFGTFPTYFLMANLLVVPISAVLTYLSIAGLLLASFGLLFPWFAWLLNGGVDLMNGITLFFAKLPHALLQFQTVDVLTTCGLLVLIFLLGRRTIPMKQRWIAFLVVVQMGMWMYSISALWLPRSEFWILRAGRGGLEWYCERAEALFWRMQLNEVSLNETKMGRWWSYAEERHARIWVSKGEGTYTWNLPLQHRFWLIASDTPLLLPLQNENQSQCSWLYFGNRRQTRFWRGWAAKHRIRFYNGNQDFDQTVAYFVR